MNKGLVCLELHEGEQLMTELTFNNIFGWTNPLSHIKHPRSSVANLAILLLNLATFSSKST